MRGSQGGGATCDVIGATVECCIEEVVGGLLERGQHEHAVLHLGDAKPGDAQHLALQCMTG